MCSTHHQMVDKLHRTLDSNQVRTFGHQKIRYLTSVSSPHGEPLPPPPRACFGRSDLIEQVIDLAGNLKPVALTGAGGIGKTSVALIVLHDGRIKERFGDNRRFIRCDQFPASLLQFLSKLSKAIGADINNPENLICLHQFLSSAPMIIFLDNAESILDPQGPDARGIYSAIEELSRFDNICVGITSRISTIPPRFKRPTISTLSTESACDIFYDIYEDGGRSDVITDLVKQLDFHALSITLLATTASHNMWDYDRLTKEWDAQRTQVLQTDYGESLAVAIELSLSSPSFHKLGPHARDLLGVIAFFPQGVDENNLDWLFPTIPDRKTIFDKFRVLSLTFRNGKFATMLAPIRDYLCPRDPTSSALLCATRDHYFTRLSFEVVPGRPMFEEARWIVSEDVNVEHLLDVFTSIDIDSDAAWDACVNFMKHLYWHKVRHTALGPKIEGLPDGHHYKPRCLTQLSELSDKLGNYAEQKRLLAHALKLERERGGATQVAYILEGLSTADAELGLFKEGIEEVKEALGIHERLEDVLGQSDCWISLAQLLDRQGRFDEAEEPAARALDLLPEKGQEYRVCTAHRILSGILRHNGEGTKAIHHLGEALGIASALGWDDELFWINYELAQQFFSEGKLDGADTHIERAKSFAGNDAYNLGRAMKKQADICYRRNRVEEATSEALGALKIYEKLGASEDIKICKDLLRKIEKEGELQNVSPLTLGDIIVLEGPTS